MTLPYEFQHHPDCVGPHHGSCFGKHTGLWRYWCSGCRRGFVWHPNWPEHVCSTGEQLVLL